MKQLYNILFIVALLPAVAFANNDKFKGKYTKEKKIHKEYDVNANAVLEIVNSFGNITIETWNQNKTVLDIVIKTNGNKEDKVIERLEDISVNFTASGSKVFAKTMFEKKTTNWWGKGNNNVSVDVSYTIKMPITNSVDLSNDFGTVRIDKLEGHAKITNDHGKLILGALWGEDNLLNFDHSGNSTIEFMKSGKIYADHSSYTLNKAESLQLNCDHTKTEIGEVKDLNYNNDFGKISINKVNNILGRGEHIGHNIGTVSGSLDIKTDFGGVRVDRLEKTCKNVLIKSEYGSVKLGLASDYNFDFVANLNYAGLKGKELLTFTKKHEDHSDKVYEGYFGTQGSGNTVTIISNFGGITLTKL
ncbi:hypothetical protein G5B37_02850 [Rasiella rasia]|uniref:Adhesin domain-containing protein n=1 Tax=Rasiella rasia TaxID=2744027 RepID=A0A6G6GJ09_9FLAO|nr:hypothetical protein [Rasiella rasia]QIE58532.1 hypothetical protein G5B37_02850 [Rasiella rasia]